MADMMEETDDRLVIRKLIPASREEVFAAWSDPAGMRYWMCLVLIRYRISDTFFSSLLDFRVLSASLSPKASARRSYPFTPKPHNLLNQFAVIAFALCAAPVQGYRKCARL